MAESQQHGFELERLARESLCYPGAPHQKHGLEYDIPAGHSTWSGHPAQIKTCSGRARSVMLGDAMRNQARDEPFELLVAVWRQDGDRKAISEYARMEFSAASWKKMFGSATERDIRALDSQVKAIPVNQGSQPVARAAAHAANKQLREKHAPILSLQPKIGASSPQRRLQASCGLDKLLANSDRHDIIREDRFEEHGLPASIYGPPRIFAARSERHGAEDVGDKS